MDGSQALDPRKTVFVGGVPRPLRAGIFFSNLSIVNVQLFLMVWNCWSAVNILFIMMPVVSLKILQCQCLYVL